MKQARLSKHTLITKKIVENFNAFIKSSAVLWLMLMVLALCVSAQQYFKNQTTEDRLARFDGARFKFFNKSNTPEMPNNQLFSVFTDTGNFGGNATLTARIISGQSNLSGKIITFSHNNYPTAATGTLVVSKAALIINAEDKTKVYGAPNPPFTPVFSSNKRFGLSKLSATKEKEFVS